MKRDSITGTDMVVMTLISAAMVVPMLCYMRRMTEAIELIADEMIFCDCEEECNHDSEEVILGS